MPRQGDRSDVPALQVRGTVDVEKFMASRVLGGEQTSFELRAMKPVRPGSLQSSCIICIICIICVVCSIQTAERFNIKGLPRLEGGT